MPPVVDQGNALERAAPDQPVDAHWLPSQLLTVEMLRRLLESAQPTSWAFTQRAKESGLLPSMGTIGDAYDHAMIESFWSRMQTELLDRRRWRTRLELTNAIFDYLEVFHNRQRRHSALGWRTPMENEKLHATDVA